MNRSIRHIVEPRRLWLVWQPGAGGAGRRYVIAEVVNDSSGVILRYLRNTPDWAAAIDQGCSGYPAFKMTIEEHREGVLDVLMKRMPPSNRSDFAEFLRSHRLPVDASIPAFSLLGYTGAKLPGDGFSLLIDFQNVAVPFEFVTEVAGARHYLDDQEWWELRNYAGPLALKLDDENVVDPGAVAVFAGEKLVGYINRVYAPYFRTWLQTHSVQMSVEKINGTSDRRVLYGFVEVR